MWCRAQFDWAFVEGCVLFAAEALQCGVLVGLRSLDHVGGPLRDAVLIGPNLAGLHILTLVRAARFPIFCSFPLAVWMVFCGWCFYGGRAETNVAPLIANCNTFVKKVHASLVSSTDALSPGSVMGSARSGRDFPARCIVPPVSCNASGVTRDPPINE